MRCRLARSILERASHTVNPDITTSDPAQQIEHAHIANMSTLCLLRKEELSDAWQPTKKLSGGDWQGLCMVLSASHTASENGPQPPFQIDLGPFRADDFIGARTR